MFEVGVPEEVVEYAGAVLMRQSFGRRGKADGNPGQQLIGLVGEVLLQDLFRAPCTKATGGPDGGVDLLFHGVTIDVKTMRRDAPVRPQYVNNFSGLQAQSPSRALIFCSLNWNRRVLTVCGWTLKDLFFRVAEFSPKGTKRYRADGTHFPAEADLYEIRNCDLYSPCTLQELRDEILTLSIAEGRCSCHSCVRNGGQVLRKTALDVPISTY